MASSKLNFEGPTRFKSKKRLAFSGYKKAADMYPQLLSDEEKLGFKQKPFDWSKGHPNYLNNMYQLLNGIAVMDLEQKAAIVEVGSGAGWVTEILISLGYRLECIEPSQIMIDAAKERVMFHLEAHAMGHLVGNVKFHCSMLEEADLAEGTADAVLFFESFHHIIDEHTALQQVQRVLRPGGVLCILGDSNWIPGLREQEDFWESEMDRFGTLESPFTHDYLVALLEQHGFESIQRYHGVNGLVPVERGDEPVSSFAGHLTAAYVNLFTARRPRISTEAQRPVKIAHLSGAPAIVHHVKRWVPRFLAPSLARVWHLIRSFRD